MSFRAWDVCNWIYYVTNYVHLFLFKFVQDDYDVDDDWNIQIFG